MMKIGKPIGSNLIPVEILKCFGEEGLEYLTELFNVIFRMTIMPILFNGEPYNYPTLQE